MSENLPESAVSDTTVDPDAVRDAARPIIGGDAATLPAATPQEGRTDLDGGASGDITSDTVDLRAD
jgi:hypothetical protein